MRWCFTREKMTTHASYIIDKSSRIPGDLNEIGNKCMCAEGFNRLCTPLYSGNLKAWTKNPQCSDGVQPFQEVVAPA